MEKLAFVTTNVKKFEQISAVLKDYGIELEHVNIKYPEDQEAEMADISKIAAKDLADKLQRPVIVEDTGFFLHAYNNFPGPLAKFVHKGIGLEGIMKLLEGKKRDAAFACSIGYCEPGQESITFEGECQCQVTKEYNMNYDHIMPYSVVCIPDGETKVFADMTIEEKNKYSHRGMAARKLGEYLKNKNK